MYHQLTISMSLTTMNIGHKDTLYFSRIISFSLFRLYNWKKYLYSFLIHYSLTMMTSTGLTQSVRESGRYVIDNGLINVGANILKDTT